MLNSRNQALIASSGNQRANCVLQWAITTLQLFLLMAILATVGICHNNGTEEVLQNFTTSKINVYKGLQPTTRKALLDNNTRLKGPPSCKDPTSIKHYFKYINTIISCAVFMVGMVGKCHLAEDYLPKQVYEERTQRPHRQPGSWRPPIYHHRHPYQCLQGRHGSVFFNYFQLVEA